METDRPHRSNSINNSSSSSNSTTSELFICFTSRLSSSSSMKIPSKSLLSPGRAREGSQISLSNSLSRRLRSNGSMKGGQASPMFPTNGKKRGCSFENPEPSSPKVTCIGQVRVKTKKQGNKMRARSKRRGDVSFRRIEQSSSSNNPNNGGVEVGNNQNLQDYSEEGLSQHQQRNQRWVDLPVTICEALRTFGAELNCFLPCRSSCMAGEKVKEEGNRSSNGSCTNKENSSCGAVFRWLVAVEGDGKGREIELVVGEEEEEEEDGGGRRRSYRRHVFDEIEFSEEKLEKDNNEAEEGGRVSISIPPKNALLLMRCRSDPVKMAALANKFWEPPLPNDEEEDDNEEKVVVVEEKVEKGCVEVVERQEKVVVVEKEELLGHQEHLVTEKLLSCPEQEEPQLNDCNTAGAALEDGGDQDFQEIGADIDCNIEEDGKEVTENPVMVSSLEGEDVADPGNEDDDMVQESEHGHQEQENTEDITDDVQEDTTVQFVQTEQESEVSVIQNMPDQELEPQPEEPEPPEAVSLEAMLVQEEEKETSKEEEEEAEIVTLERPDPVTQETSDPITQEGETGRKSTERESQPILPDCLLLMMCEPKLSMEVSKETWVCSTDFIRWLPEPSRPPVNKKNGGDEPKKRISIDLNPPPAQSNNNNTTVLQQPPRSSCSYPAKPPPRAGGAQSMATAIEQKLVNSKGFEPFVLTRCKSEPMRTASKLAPEACFWKNRKLEPHRPATRAAGVGF